MIKANFLFILFISFGLNAQKLSEDSIAELPIDSTLQFEDNESADYVNDSKTVKKEKSKLVRKADGFFDKMWYAEAAKFYDLAIEENKEKPSRYLLSRSGDSHYFNSNIKQAYERYHMLYKEYEDEISENSLFNYVHTLKGTGRKRRANRIMAVMNKKNAKKLKEDAAAIRESLEEESRFNLKNLKINSKYSDFSPMYYGKDKLLYTSAKDTLFLNTRKYKWDNQPYLDLYTAKVDSTNNDASGTYRFSKNVNTKYHEASASFSPDNKTIYFTRNNYGKKKIKRDKKGINHLKLYMSKEINGEWTEAIELPFNSDNYSTGHPALTADGKKLFFVSDMPGGYGGTDIYVVDVLENGTFSKPRNLGLAVNSSRKEMFPFITKNKLYFSSNRASGLGGLDIYESNFSAEGFSKAENLGAPFNSNRDDFSLIIDEDTEKGYFASNRPGGKGKDDIYSFVPTRKSMPNLNEISGYIVDRITGDSLPNAMVSLYNDENVRVGEIRTNEKGSFRFNNLKSTDDYTLQTILEGYFEETTSVATKNNEVVDVIQPMKRLQEMIVVEEGVKKLKTEMIFFDFDRFNIRQDASEELDKLVEVMKEYPTMVIKVESHTDAIGNAAYNKYLSGKRATSTKEYLIAQGIDSSRIESAIGYGEERLLNDCGDGVRCSKERHRQNRRSEFIIVNM
ncbi:OmpA family protein [Croceitalea sp. MTPC9]|uniref:OmpA family protein n=1 Tax=unclassified Croceitalea TaxID=2632280 RepID=UPI002B37BB39|nr:OmpA family protein [Croceitalea sp. MTPC6]GMN16602.1 OmpA family protein [Croceitalea sp. MTPC9]